MTASIIWYRDSYDLVFFFSNSVLVFFFFFFQIEKKNTNFPNSLLKSIEIEIWALKKKHCFEKKKNTDLWKKKNTRS